MEREFQSVRRAPSDAERNGYLGMLLHAHDRTEAALTLYQRAHALKPEDHRWAYLTGAVQASLSRSNEAAESFRKTLQLKAGDTPAMLGLADALAAAGQFTEARDWYGKVLAREPDMAVAWYGAGRTWAGEGQHEKASAHFRRAVELFPGYGAAHYALAQALQKQGDAKAAETELAAYEKDRTGTPPRPDPLLASVRSLNRGILPLLAQAKRAAAEGRPDEAITLHLQALGIDPKQEQIHINLISLYGRTGKVELAERAFRRAVELNAGRDEAHYNYGVMMASTGRLNEASEAYRTALKLNPRHAEAHNNLAHLLAQHGRFEEALQHASSALESRPGYPQAHYNAATILMRRGRSEEAAQHLKAAVQPGDPNAVRYLQTLSELLQRTGRSAEAQRYARQAREWAQ